MTMLLESVKDAARYIHYKACYVEKKKNIETCGGMFLNKLRAVMRRTSD